MVMVMVMADRCGRSKAISTAGPNLDQICETVD
jgi:hypothetical protein